MTSNSLSKVLEKYNANPEVLFAVIQKRNLSFLLPAALKLLKLKEEKEKFRNEVVLESAFEVSDENLKILEEKVGEKVEKKIINKNLVTGFKVYTRNRILDASLDTLLKQILQK